VDPLGTIHIPLVKKHTVNAIIPVKADKHNVNAIIPVKADKHNVNAIIPVKQINTM